MGKCHICRMGKSSKTSIFRFIFKRWGRARDFKNRKIKTRRILRVLQVEDFLQCSFKSFRNRVFRFAVTECHRHLLLFIVLSTLQFTSCIKGQLNEYRVVQESPIVLSASPRNRFGVVFKSYCANWRFGAISLFVLGRGGNKQRKPSATSREGKCRLSVPGCSNPPFVRLNVTKFGRARFATLLNHLAKEFTGSSANLIDGPSSSSSSAPHPPSSAVVAKQSTCVFCQSTAKCERREAQIQFSSEEDIYITTNGLLFEEYEKVLHTKEW